MKADHEFRDPIHGFIHMSDDELRVVQSPPFQRLRHIRQLALSHLVYPGATHTRFEHSLGVMELAGRVFDIVTSQRNLHPDVRDQLAKELTEEKKAEWRKILRFAALCHDLGHLPFSHAGEGLLPDGWEKHDSISARLIMEERRLQGVWKSMEPQSPAPELVARIAVGINPSIWKPLKNTDAPVGDAWKDALCQIITDDAFGVDRMDFLLRDAYYTGVPNGVFDHRQLIESLRILPHPDGRGGALSLGLVGGGLRSAEALMMARYFMYQQVYYHRTRKIYDFHLQQFLGEFLKNGEFGVGGKFRVEPEAHQRLTDIEVWSAIRKAANNKRAPGHLPARRIVFREHFKCAYEHRPGMGTFSDIVDELRKKFKGRGKEIIQIPGRKNREKKSEGAETPSFMVLEKDGKIRSVEYSSELPKQILRPSFGYVFADEEVIAEVKGWFKEREGENGRKNKRENNTKEKR